MARINIEESILKDRRFVKFMLAVGDQDKALGALFRAWMVAQKWYLIGDRMIPLEEWDKQELLPGLIEVGLAEKVGADRVRMRGADEQFGWLLQRANAGKKGGVATAAGRLSVAKRSPSGREASLLFSPFSNTKENTFAQNELAQKPDALPPKQPARTACAVPGFVEKIERIYFKYPRHEGKSRGITRLKTQLKTEESVARFEKAVENYARHVAKEGREREHIKIFSTFCDPRVWVDFVDDAHAPKGPVWLESDRQGSLT